MKRAVVVILLVLILLLAAYAFNRYWTHRFDSLIARQAAIYRVDPDLVWSIIYEETYFSPWKTGKDGEIGLMQVTPTVGREWATETGMRELERQMATDPRKSPARSGTQHSDRLLVSRKDLRTVSGQAGSRDANGRRLQCWTKPRGRVEPDAAAGNVQSGAEFINRIDIPSTKAYVLSIMQRYRRAQEFENVERCAAADFTCQMTTIYSARWVLPVSAPPIENGAVAVEGQRIVGVGTQAEIVERFPEF